MQRHEKRADGQPHAIYVNHDSCWAMQFPHLFSPLWVGAIELANRIVLTGHDIMMVVDGMVSEAHGGRTGLRGGTAHQPGSARSQP